MERADRTVPALGCIHLLDNEEARVGYRVIAGHDAVNGGRITFGGASVCFEAVEKLKMMPKWLVRHYVNEQNCRDIHFVGFANDTE